MRVVDEKGKTRILLTTKMLDLKGLKRFSEVAANGAVIIGTNNHGGNISVTGKDGVPSIILSTQDTDERASVAVIDAQGYVIIDTD